MLKECLRNAKGMLKYSSKLTELKLSHATSASLPEAQLIAYYLREPPRPEIMLKANPCREGSRNFSLEKQGVFFAQKKKHSFG